jgi:L-iditol 2-dehydrogenase
VRLTGTYHHAPRHVAQALELLSRGDRPWQTLCGPTVELDRLAAALRGELGDETRYTVRPNA